MSNRDMEPRIVEMAEKKLVGERCRMSIADNKTTELWQRFMPKKGHINNTVGSELYSAEVYDPLFFTSFDPAKKFEKWAVVEVSDFNSVPEGMKTIIFPNGLYAVFVHKGPASTGPKTYQYIYNTWIPNSDFSIDTRPHFAVMGEKYKPNSPDSEEEIWIPIKEKGS